MKLNISVLLLAAAGTACGGENDPEVSADLTKRVQELARFSFERVLTADDLEAATVSFVHQATRSTCSARTSTATNAAAWSWACRTLSM